MPKASPIFQSFNGGELSPLMNARTDFSKYNAGLNLCEGYIPLVQGPLERRPGFHFVNEVKDSSKKTRLIPFEFSTTQAYQIELGDQYMRFYKDNGLILETAQNITGVSAATPAVITIVGHGYSTGDEVYISGTGVAALDDLYHVITYVDADNFSVAANGTGWVSGGTVARIHEVTTPYLEADLFEIKFVQSADVMYLTHPSYQQRELTRTGHAAWTLTTMVFEDGPYLTVNATEVGLHPDTATESATVSALNPTKAITGVISASHEASQNITNITAATPAVITINTHGYSNGETVWVTGTGVTALDNKYHIVSNVTVNTFEVPPDGTGWVSGGTAERASTTSAEITIVGHGYSDGDAAYFLSTGVASLDGNFLTISNVTADTFDVTADGTTWSSGGTAQTTGESAFNGGLGFVSTDVGRQLRIYNGTAWAWGIITAINTVYSIDVSIESTENFPTTFKTEWRIGIWSDTTGYPSTVTFFEDRLTFAGSTEYPQRIDGSNTGAYTIFSPTDPDGTVIDSNAIALTLNATSVNKIRWIVDSEKGLVAGTVGGEWLITPSNNDEALSPSNVKAKRSTANGSADVAPLRIGETILYLQKSKRKVRELKYKFEKDGLVSPDMTVLAEHITKSGVVEMAYQQEPHSIVWAVREDGQLCSMTYDSDQDVNGWHRHKVGGYSNAAKTADAIVESVSVIPSIDDEYDEVWIVVKRYINGGVKRYIEYMHSFWDEDIPLADSFYVDSGLTYDGASATVISGLEHLEGETVEILADGSKRNDQTVSGGQITLTSAASKIHIGFGYKSKGRTMKIEAGAADGTAQGKTKRIHEVVFRVQGMGGFYFGPDDANLDEHVFRTTDDLMDTAVPLYTGDFTEEWDDDYDTDGQIYFEQNGPLPGRVLAIMPQVITQD